LLSALALAGPALAQEQAAAAPSELPPGKLPDTVVPLAYRLDLTLDPAQERFSGRVEIDARLERAAGTIYLHGRNLAMRRAWASVAGKAVDGVWRQGDPTGVVALTFAAALPAGPVTFGFEYDAAFAESPAGLFRVRVGEDWYSWSQFQSIDARAAFPAFDEPGFKTPFTITVRTRPGMLAVSNAPLAATVREGGLDVHRFAPTLPLPTYLVAVMTGPFATVGGEVPPGPHRAAPLPLQVISPRPNAGGLDFALAGSKDIVPLLEDYFADGFPFPKLDQITTPILPGAMENAGAILYNDAIIAMDGKASVARQRQFGMVVAHELSHQWFGDLVTPKWWDDIWLNESFANWMGYRIGSEWRPDLKIGGGGLAEGFAAMDTDSLLAGRPIRQPILINAQIDASFDDITYGKGGHVVAMIAGYLGDARFRAGVRRYMAAHRFGNASSDDFFRALAAEAGEERLVDAMRSFTDQQGVPLLTFGQKGDVFTVTQLRYAPIGSAPGPTRWTVPLCVRRGATRQCQLLAERSASLTLTGKGPLMPNADGLGYYRFELPRRGWDALIREADRLPPGEAQALADSLGASLKAGRATTAQVMTLARKLSRHPDSHAFAAAGTLLDALTGADLIDASAITGYRALVSRVYAPALRQLGFDPRAGVYASEDPERSERRAEAVARLSGGARQLRLRRQLRDAADAFMQGDAAALDPQWLSPAFAVWLEYDMLARAKLLGDRALASQDPVFRPAALNALATSGGLSIAAWLLDDWRDERLRSSERRALLEGIMASRATREFGYRWLRRNLASLPKGDDGLFFVARLPRVLGGFCTLESARELERDLRAAFAGKPAELEFARALERVRNCSLLREAMAARVSEAVAGARVFLT
jgi:aminopeptidase N